jgi:hypothetical protein
LAELIAPLTEFVRNVNSWLTLHGLRLVYLRNVPTAGGTGDGVPTAGGTGDGVPTAGGTGDGVLAVGGTGDA